MQVIDEMFDKFKTEESKHKVEEAFKALTGYLNTLDPVKLLTQLSLTYLTNPEGEFRKEGHEVHKWSRWIEFVAGYLLVNAYPQSPEKEIDGRNLEQLEKLLEDYFNAIVQHEMFGSANTENTTRQEQDLLFFARTHSLHVRGDTYPHKFLELAIDLYSQHDEFFKAKYGFTIQEAVKLHSSIIQEYERRVHELIPNLKAEARRLTEKHIEEDQSFQRYKDQIETSNFCQLFFGNSDKHLSFSLEEFVEFSKFPKKTCENFLKRLSQSFGYHNSEFPDTFKESLLAPWDYNTLYERPIVFKDDKYFLPNNALLPTVLFYTFHYDLIRDDDYKDTYNRMRGDWLEDRTRRVFANIFGGNSVFINPKYPNGEELTDVLVLYDRKVFIIQCKSKGLRYDSKIGSNFASLKLDIEKGIKDSFEQGVRARKYLLENQNPIICVSNGEFVLDMTQVTDIFILSVTLGQYQSFFTRVANISGFLNLFQENDYPWAVSLFDLEVVAEVLASPSFFIHFTQKRVNAEKVEAIIFADEVDFLHVYLEQGLNLDTSEFKDYNMIALTSFSFEVDEYMYRKYWLEEEFTKPKPKLPDHFKDYIIAIERLDTAYKTDCNCRLLDLDYPSKKAFVDKILTLKERQIEKGKITAVKYLRQEQNLGIAFVALNGDSSIDSLFKQVSTYSLLEKYKAKVKEWVSLGWDRNSDRLVDTIFFCSFDWQKDEGFDKVISQTQSRTAEI